MHSNKSTEEQETHDSQQGMDMQEQRYNRARRHQDTSTMDALRNMGGGNLTPCQSYEPNETNPENLTLLEKPYPEKLTLMEKP